MGTKPMGRGLAEWQELCRKRRRAYAMWRTQKFANVSCVGKTKLKRAEVGGRRGCVHAGHTSNSLEQLSAATTGKEGQ